MALMLRVCSFATESSAKVAPFCAISRRESRLLSQLSSIIVGSVCFAAKGRLQSPRYPSDPRLFTFRCEVGPAPAGHASRRAYTVLPTGSVSSQMPSSRVSTCCPSHRGPPPRGEPRERHPRDPPTSPAGLGSPMGR